MASPRQLAYKDRFVWHLEEIISSIFDDCDDFTDRYVFPDMTTRVPMVMYLSQEQFTTLYSAVMTGADLTYPDTNQDVEYLFLQMLMCPMSQLCAALADCLLTNEATRNALLQALAEMGNYGGIGDGEAPLSDGSLASNLLPDGYSCTDDKAYGMALAVVEAINDATTEVLQAIEVVTNPMELAAELGDNVPGVGILSSAGDVARWIQNTAKEEYDLAWSTVVRDELACALWCEFKGACSLSYDDIWGIYLSKSNTVPPTSVQLFDWLAWLILLPFVGATSTVATISLLGLLAMRYGGSFGDFVLGIRSMELVINLAQDDSSSDWSIVCDPCNVLATPIIDDDPCYGGGGIGTLSHLGGTRWRLTCDNYPSVDYGYIRREGPGCFVLNNVVYTVGTPTYFGWELCDLECTTGSTPPGFGVGFLSLAFIRNGGNLVVEFDFFGVA